MRRHFFHDKIDTAYGNRKNELLNDIFRRHFEPFNQRNGWLNSKQKLTLCYKRKLLHSDEDALRFLC